MEVWIYEPSPWVEFYAWGLVVLIDVIVIGAIVGLGVIHHRGK